MLDPAAISGGTLDQLDTTVLLTPSAYLVTTVPGTTAPSTGAEAGRRNVAAGGSTTWYLGTPLELTSLTIAVTHDPGGVGPGVHVGLVRPAGSTDWTVPVRRSDGAVSITLATPAPVVAVRVTAGNAALDLAPPVLRTASGVSSRADGQLQDALVPPHWVWHGLDGAFAVFGDARPPRRSPCGPVPTGPTPAASVRATSGPGFAPTSAAVSSSRAVTVVRAVADIPGGPRCGGRSEGEGRWRCRSAAPASCRRSPCPPDGGVVSWRYDPPGLALGLWVSLGALVLSAAAGLALFMGWRRSKRACAGPRSGAGRIATGRCGPWTARHTPTPWRPGVVPRASRRVRWRGRVPSRAGPRPGRGTCPPRRSAPRDRRWPTPR